MTSPSPFTGEGNRGGAAGGRGRALARARAMRHEPTEAERVLWRLLRAKRLAGWKWRRQQPIGAYIADFVCFETRLIVEADGSQHLDSEGDARRDGGCAHEDFGCSGSGIMTSSPGLTPCWKPY